MSHICMYEKSVDTGSVEIVGVAIVHTILYICKYGTVLLVVLMERTIFNGIYIKVSLL